MITIGVICSQFNSEITDEMLAVALARAQERNIQVRTMRCPGAFDIPFCAQHMLREQDIAGVVALGALVTGETDHDQVIAYVAAEKLAALSLQYNKPVALGITGPKQTYEQAVARIPRAADTIDACLDLIQAAR